jgi:hypothetical protein
LGAGYALTLGVPGPEAGIAGWRGVGQLVRARPLLFVGVFVYMFAGFAVCVTYAVHEGETPDVLKTIAVAFGGYVIAYLGTAYRQLSQ